MEYREIVERIDGLLEETDEIERVAREIQLDRPSSWTQEQTRDFRKRYQDWYASALLTLPDDTKAPFMKEYMGGKLQHGIQKFISDPARPNPIFAKAALENPDAISSLYWMYPVETTFERRFVEQQALLRQARERHVMHSTIPERSIPGLLGGWAGEGSSAGLGEVVGERAKHRVESRRSEAHEFLNQKSGIRPGYLDRIAVILKDDFKLADINKFFELSDTNPAWKVEPVTDYPQERIRLTLSWFQGIAQNAPDELMRVTHSVVEQMIDQDGLSESNRRDLITMRKRLQDKMVDQAKGLAVSEDGNPSGARTTTIFVAHGHNATWAVLVLALQSHWDVTFEYFESSNHTAQQITDVVREMTTRSSLAVILMTGEDTLADGSSRARQNVIHEAGMCHAALGFDKVALLIEPNVEKFSNAQGIVYIPFDPNHVNGCLHDLEAFLERSGAKRVGAK